MVNQWDLFSSILGVRSTCLKSPTLRGTLWNTLDRRSCRTQSTYLGGLVGLTTLLPCCALALISGLANRACLIATLRMVGTQSPISTTLSPTLPPRSPSPRVLE